MGCLLTPELTHGLDGIFSALVKYDSIMMALLLVVPTLFAGEGYVIDFVSFLQLLLSELSCFGFSPPFFLSRLFSMPVCAFAACFGNMLSICGCVGLYRCTPELLRLELVVAR